MSTEQSYKVLMLATTAAMIEQFNKNNILLLENMGYEVHVIGNWKDGNPISEERLTKFKIWLEKHHCKWFHMPSTRRPTDINNIKAYKQVVRLIKQEKYDFIHCHTPLGSVIARCAAHKTKTKVIYTAHGFHFYKGAPTKNWLFYYPVEKFLSRWTDILILINQEDYNRAKRSFHAKDIQFVPGVGIDLDKFCELDDKDRKDMKRAKLGVGTSDRMLLSVGELIPRKNHEIVIRAIKKVNDPHIKYYICGKGSLKDHLQMVIKELELENQVFLLGYRQDVCELCQISDAFVFPSIQEGLPVALMEAMACRTVVIASNIRGCNDLIKNEKCLFNPSDLKTIVGLIQEVLNDDCSIYIKENYDNILLFDIKRINSKMEKIYKQISHI